MNPGGSCKDRMGRRMLLDAEKIGKIKKGDVLIEATSGNTGIGIAICAAARGYRMIATMPEKVSAEKEAILKGLGVEIVRTPTEYKTDHIGSFVGVAMTLTETLENAFMLDQRSNPSNPISHYDGTGPEIWEQCEGKIDVIIIAAGSGGTATGVARYFKDKDPIVKIVAVDVEGSIIAQPTELNICSKKSIIEGLGVDYIPRTLDRTCIDKWYKCSDSDAFSLARRIIKEEGLLVGASSGCALWGALQEAKELDEDKRIVIILPDSIRNYMTKFVSDDWMYLNGFLDEKTVLDGFTPKLVPNRAWGQEYTVGDLPLKKSITVSHKSTVSETIKAMGTHNEILVVDDDNKVIGFFSTSFAMEKISKGKIVASDNVMLAVNKLYRKTSKDIPLSELSRIFTLTSFVVVDDESILTHHDVLNFFLDKS